MRKHMVVHGGREGLRAVLWLPGKLASDLTLVGVGNTRIVIKTNTEPAIVDLRNDIAKTRSDVPTGFDDSRVGDSDSSGRTERAIRDLKGSIGT